MSEQEPVRMSGSTPIVRSQPLSQQVTEAIRHMILTGKLAPNETVTQERLADLLSVSTMPVREALLRLSHEGFVEARRNRSFQIARTSREDVEDVYKTHAFLAGELTARASFRGGPELAKELREIDRQWSGAEMAQLESLNWQFHRAINLAAASPRLLLFLRNTIRFIPDQFYALLPEWREISERGHKDIVTAISARDEEFARRAASEHVRDAGQLLISHFADTGFWAPPDRGNLAIAGTPSTKDEGK